MGHTHTHQSPGRIGPCVYKDTRCELLYNCCRALQMCTIVWNSYGLYLVVGFHWQWREARRKENILDDFLQQTWTSTFRWEYQPSVNIIPRTLVYLWILLMNIIDDLLCRRRVTLTQLFVSFKAPVFWTLGPSHEPFKTPCRFHTPTTDPSARYTHIHTHTQKHTYTHFNEIILLYRSL